MINLAKEVYYSQARSIAHNALKFKASVALEKFKVCRVLWGVKDFNLFLF